MLRLCKYFLTNCSFSGSYTLEFSYDLAYPFSEYLIHTGVIEADLSPKLYACFYFCRYDYCFNIIGGSLLTAFIIGELNHSNGYCTLAFFNFILCFINGIGLNFLLCLGFLFKKVFSNGLVSFIGDKSGLIAYYLGDKSNLTLSGNSSYGFGSDTQGLTPRAPVLGISGLNIYFQ